MPPTSPEAPVEEPLTVPQPQRPPAPAPERKRELDPFNPEWPKQRPVPEPKAASTLAANTLMPS